MFVRELWELPTFRSNRKFRSVCRSIQEFSAFSKAKKEHTHDYEDSEFVFDVLGQTTPGKNLDFLEECYIRELGGETLSEIRENLSNCRHQMSEQ
ncbi:MAG: hypothetical protein Q4P72_06410, partial [Eubacteriales bacterium]|nr:hypothetical protein [Eubacteriales bacterium]